MQRIVVTFKEGIKDTYKRITFEGNTHLKDSQLRKQMKTRGQTIVSALDKTGRVDDVQLQQDLDAIKEFYQDHGYIDVDVKDVRKERSDGRMNIVIVINEGIQYHVGRLTITGYKEST